MFDYLKFRHGLNLCIPQPNVNMKTCFQLLIVSLSDEFIYKPHKVGTNVVIESDKIYGTA
ncbi:hypothetical protein QTP88_021919 [Uroleucon formosanum]